MAVYVPRREAAIGGAVTQRETWPSFDFVLRAALAHAARLECNPEA